MVTKVAFGVGVLAWVLMLWALTHPLPEGSRLDPDVAAAISRRSCIGLATLALSVTAILVVLSEPVRGKTARLWAIAALVLNIGFLAVVIGTVLLE